VFIRCRVFLFLILLSGECSARTAATCASRYPIEKRREGLVGLLQDYIARAEVEGALGGERLAVSNERYVRYMLNRMGLAKADRVRIRRFNKYAKKWVGEKNACAVACFYLPHYLYFSEEWFNTLDEQKRRFLVGHEAAHLKCKHQQKRYAVSVAYFVVWVTAVESVHQVAGRWFPILRRKICCLAAELGCLGALSAAFSSFMRAQEREADLRSAASLNATEGGIALMKELQADEEELLGEMSAVSRILYRAFTFFRAPFQTHPTPVQRISYLQDHSQQNTS